MSATWARIDSGSVYHCLLPTEIEGFTTSPNISRATSVLLPNFEGPAVFAAGAPYPVKTSANELGTRIRHRKTILLRNIPAPGSCQRTYQITLPFEENPRII